MKKIIISTIFAGLAACASNTPAPTGRQPLEEPPPRGASEEEGKVSSAEEPDSRELVYNWRNGRTRVYLPLTSSICAEDEAASPRYQVAGLWKFDPNADAWTVVDVNSEGGWRIGCNAMLDLIDVFGFDLEPGTYAIAASLDGVGERAVFAVGPVQCDDEAIEPPPPGTVAACIIDSGNATWGYVPDPAKLKP